MKPGNLVRHTRSESGMTGVIVKLVDRNDGSGAIGLMPVVLWADGRCNPVVPEYVEVIDESG